MMCRHVFQRHESYHSRCDNVQIILPFCIGPVFVKAGGQIVDPELKLINKLLSQFRRDAAIVDSQDQGESNVDRLRGLVLVAQALNNNRHVRRQHDGFLDRIEQRRVRGRAVQRQLLCKAPFAHQLLRALLRLFEFDGFCRADG